MDLNEEFSAIHYPSLKDQSLYIGSVIEYILSKHPGVQTFPLIGHSMGGFVIQHALKNYHSSINNNTNVLLSKRNWTIFTIAAPLREAPVPVDSRIVQEYSMLNTDWEMTFPNTLLVSIGGGNLDRGFYSDLCRVKHGIYRASSGLHGIWSGADHEGLLWCNQFVRKLGGIIIDSNEWHGLLLSERKAWMEERLKEGLDVSGRSFALQATPSDALVKTEIMTRVRFGDRVLGKSLGPESFIAIDKTPSFSSKTGLLQVTWPQSDSETPGADISIKGCKKDSLEDCVTLLTESQMIPHEPLVRLPEGRNATRIVVVQMERLPEYSTLIVGSKGNIDNVSLLTTQSFCTVELSYSWIGEYLLLLHSFSRG